LKLPRRMGPPRSMVNTSASDAGATKSLRCAITSGRIAVGTVTVRAPARDLGGVRTSPRPTRSMNGELTRTQLPSRATSPRRNAVTSPQRNEQNAVSRIRTPISALGHRARAPEQRSTPGLLQRMLLVRSSEPARISCDQPILDRGSHQDCTEQPVRLCRHSLGQTAREERCPPLPNRPKAVVVRRDARQWRPARPGPEL
jgi:hypothetical protein